MAQRILLIQLSSEEQISVRGKLADIIYWMVRNKHRIEPIHTGELSVNWSEGGVDQRGSFRPTVRDTLPSERFST